jgi:hypothetical protein
MSDVAEGVNSWILEPASRLVDYAVEEARFALVVPKALIIAAGFRNYLLIAQRFVLDEQPTASQGLDELLARQEAIELGASELLDGPGGESSVVTRHSIVGLWSAVEVTVEDTLVACLMRSDQARCALRRNGVTFHEETSGPGSEFEMRVALSKLESKFKRSNGVNSAGAYVSMLRELEIPMRMPEKELATFSELCYVRNCILHRGGAIDSRAEREAPRFVGMIGQPVELSEALWSSYYGFVGRFAGELISSLGRSPYTRWLDEASGEWLSGADLEARDPSAE